MKKQSRIKIRVLALMFVWVLGVSNTMATFNASAADEAENTSGGTSSLALSPMLNKIVLNPGDNYTGTFKISVPTKATVSTSYKISVQNFYRDDDNNAIFEEVGETGKILDWTTINSNAIGTLNPNETTTVDYTISVPETAPAGGQYVAITVETTNGEVGGGGDSAAIQESLAIAYLVYAEITGDTVHQGETISVDVPSFLLSGNITGSALVKNTGNVHEEATYKLQVFPLFSDEEVYTNEEKPDGHVVFPDRTLYNETMWEGTPALGIFNVVYTVEFEGVTTQVSKMVIKCPIWLLFIIIFAIAALIIWIVMRVRARGKSPRKTADTPKSE